MFNFFRRRNQQTTNQQTTYTPPPPPPPPPQRKLTEEPWRKTVHWSTEFEQSLVKEIKEFHPEKKHNLLMSGPVGVGKSSFICAVLSIDKNRRYGASITGDNAESSQTLDLIKFPSGTLLEGFRIYDCMGIELGVEKGMHLDDFTPLIEGHIKNGYTFKPEGPITNKSKKYKHHPGVFDQMHCVIFVASAPSVHAGISPAYVHRIKQLQAKIKHTRIPRILILTKVEHLCDEVEKDITNIFRSLKIKETVEIASEIFAIEKASIHPVKNYEDDSKTNTASNILLLLALRQAKEYASDRVELLSAIDTDDSSD